MKYRLLAIATLIFPLAASAADTSFFGSLSELAHSIFSQSAEDQPKTPEQKDFFSSFIENPTAIGAIAESSSYLAEEITKYFDENCDRPLRILEVGAGTGVFTRALAVKLRPGDTLDVVELTEDFMSQLWQEFGDNPSISIHWADILAFEPESGKAYDLIVSGVPFNALDQETVFKILDKYRAMSKNGTIISYFEYSALPTIRRLVGSADYSATRDTIEGFISLYQFNEETVLRNLPPATVHHLMIKSLPNQLCVDLADGHTIDRFGK